MGIISFSRPIGISYLEVYFHSSHPFFLVHGTEVMVPIYVMVHLAQLAVASKLSGPHDRIDNVEALDERRHVQSTSVYLIRNRSINPITEEYDLEP